MRAKDKWLTRDIFALCITIVLTAIDSSEIFIHLQCNRYTKINIKTLFLKENWKLSKYHSIGG